VAGEVFEGHEGQSLDAFLEQEIGTGEDAGSLGTSLRKHFLLSPQPMTIFQTIAILLTFAAFAAYCNHRFLHLPRTIGLMAIALALSLVFMALGYFGIINLTETSQFVQRINFSETLLHGMLAFLLFAGALHVDLGDLRSQALPVIVLSTLGVGLATLSCGALFWLVAHWLGTDLPLVYALLFGALISPTDPIAVLGILRKAGAPKSLETKITGESLFNDGVGVVVFLTILGVAVGNQQPDAGHIAGFLITEAIGGGLLGVILGWMFYRLLKSVDVYQVEILLTLALAAGGYSLAEALHVSAPIAIVAAGLFIGNHGRTFGMSDTTREHLDAFWELVDEILNAILFFVIGLEFLAIRLEGRFVLIALFAIIIVLVSRFLSVGLLVASMRLKRTFSRGVVEILTWSGLRGGISIALALSLPPFPERQLILTSTYVVVAFSILVQGPTVGKVIAARTRSLEPPRSP
jgi:CPA1 family monovalent cation:H+ antiporter